MSVRPHKKFLGFSLAELLVYIAVLSVFMLGLHAAFSLALTYYHNTRARSDAFSSAKIAAAMVERLLANAAGSSVQVQPSPGPSPAAYCIFVSGQSDFDSNHPLGEFESDSDGKIFWQRRLCIFNAPNGITEAGGEVGDLRMSQEKLTGSPLPTTPPLADITKLNSMTSMGSRVIARDILVSGTFFTITSTLDDNGTSKVLVRYQITTRVKPSVGSRLAGDNLVGITIPGQVLLDN